MITGIIDSACQQGFLYAVAVFGIVFTLRFLNWPDLTVDGSFTLGGAVLARMLLAGYSPWSSMVFAGLAGFIAGTITFLLNRKLGISKIMSGILVMLVLYSINLRIMGRANLSLLRTTTFFTRFEDRGVGDPIRIAVFLGILLIVLIGLCYFVMTRIGLFLRATGDNEFMVQGLGVNTNFLFLIGLGLSNGLVAISGALVAQNQGFADVSMGTGLIITGIAALILGEGLFSAFASIRKRVLSRQTDVLSGSSGLHLLPWSSFGEIVAAAVGAFVYFLIVAICLRIGLAPTDLKLATGVLVIVAVALQKQHTGAETYARGRL